MTDDDKQKLRERAARRLMLHREDMNHDFHDSLIANKANWECGFDDKHFFYWVHPTNAMGLSIRAFGNATLVLKWDVSEVPEIVKH